MWILFLLTLVQLYVALVTSSRFQVSGHENEKQVKNVHSTVV